MSKTQMRIIGASNHADHEREKDDFYATDPIATIKLCELEKFNTDIWKYMGACLWYVTHEQSSCTTRLSCSLVRYS